MKKSFLVLLMLFVTNTISAQQDEFKKDALKVIEISGGSTQMRLIKNQLLPNVPKDKQAMFALEFDGQLAKLLDKMADLYKEIYTHDDVKEMIKFYESPIGKKIQEKTPVLFEKSQELGMQWGEELQPMLMKYLQE